MALKATFNGATIYRPGAGYVRVLTDNAMPIHRLFIFLKTLGVRSSLGNHVIMNLFAEKHRPTKP